MACVALAMASPLPGGGGHDQWVSFQRKWKFALKIASEISLLNLFKLQQTKWNQKWSWNYCNHPRLRD